MSRWDQPGVPHKGWTCVDVVDLRGDDDVEDAQYATCEMCGNERIRFAHHMEHPDHAPVSVGCVCAEKMTGDYVGPREREKRLRNRAIRRAKWLSRKWRISGMKGNPFLNIDGTNVGVHLTKFGKWGYRIGSRFSTRFFATEDKAKLALFDAMFPLSTDEGDEPD